MDYKKMWEELRDLLTSEIKMLQFYLDQCPADDKEHPFNLVKAGVLRVKKEMTRLEKESK